VERRDYYIVRWVSVKKNIEKMNTIIKKQGPINLTGDGEKD
jgi:hypothetical protein